MIREILEKNGIIFRKDSLSTDVKIAKEQACRQYVKENKFKRSWLDEIEDKDTYYKVLSFLHCNDIELIDDVIWLDIFEYDGIYQVSNQGQIKMLQRLTTYKGRSDKHRCLPEKIMKLTEDKDGYLRVHLRKDSQQKNFSVARIVATTFVSNDVNKPQVNHINMNKKDNRVINLEWVTCKENIHHYWKNKDANDIEIKENNNGM